MTEIVPRVAVQERVKPDLITFTRPDHGNGSVILAPAGFTVTDLTRVMDAYEKMQEKPSRRKGTYQAACVQSLLSWMERNCPSGSPVFGQGAENLAVQWPNPKLSLIGFGNYSGGFDHPQWHDLQAKYDFPVTKAWTDWTSCNRLWMTQSVFGEFVEAHLYEITSPKAGEELSEAAHRMIEALGGTKHVATPSKMYELSNGIKITVNEQVEVSLDRSSGESTLRYAQTHEGKGGRPVGIPKFFWIRLPVFFGEPEQLIGALLRYKNAGSGSVQWSYELFAPDLVVKAAFDAACEAVTDMGRTLFLGTPDRP